MKNAENIKNTLQYRQWCYNNVNDNIMRKPRRIKCVACNIKEIAKLAGVSHMTVSRVLNEPGRVKPETRERVMRIIKEHNYVPSTSARALISGRNYTIGLLVMYDLSQFPADFLASILQGISVALNERRYRTTLFFDQIDGRKNLVPAELLISGALDGLLIISLEEEQEVIRKIDSLKLSTVVINQRINSREEISYVAANDFEGGYQAVSHLIGLGHRQIVLLGGTPKFYTSIKRKEGYKRAFEDAGIALDQDLMLNGNFSKDDGYREMKRLLCKRQDITAVFAANDVMALGAYQAIRERGLRIPEDISVVGYDNQEFCDLVDPPLTTISKHRRAMGRKAAEIILDVIDNKSRSQRIVMPTDLIVRESTAKIKQKAK